MIPSDDPRPVRRLTFIGGVSVAIVLAAGGGVLLYYKAHRPLAQRPPDMTVFGATDLVRKGMTRDEVEARIGPATSATAWRVGDTDQGTRVTYAMEGDGAAIEVFYDRQHRCAAVER